jgi:hypothetical protein
MLACQFSFYSVVVSCWQCVDRHYSKSAWAAS